MLKKYFNFVKSSKIILVIFLIVSSNFITGCLNKSTDQGSILDPQKIKSIRVGSSKKFVRLALGSPTLTSTFDNNTYYYIKQTSSQFLFLNPKITSRTLLIVNFNSKNRVSSVRKYYLKDGKAIDFSTGKTITNTDKNNSLLNKLMKNFKYSRPAPNQ